MGYYWNKFLLHPDPPEFPSGGLGVPIQPNSTSYISLFDTNLVSTTSFPSQFPVAEESNFVVVETKPATIKGAFQKPSDYLLDTRLLKGSEILADYRNSVVKSNELCVWYEKLEKKSSNLFGDFCLVKFEMNGYMSSLLNRLETDGTALTGNIREKQYQANNINAFLAYVEESYKQIHRVGIDQSKLHDAINITRNLAKGQSKIKVGYVTLEGITIDLARMGLEKIRLREENYQPNGDEEGNEYSPLLPVNAIRKAIKELTDAKEKEEGSYNISGLLNTAATVFDKISVAISDDKNPLKKFSGLFRDISSKLAEIKDEITKAGESAITGLELINAFLCGVINGLLSLLDLVLAILGFIYGSLKDVRTVDATEYYYESREKFEAIEDLIDEITDKWDALWAAVKKCWTDIDENSLAELAKALGIDKYNKYDWAYVAGSFVFEVIVGVGLFLLTGGTATIAQATSRSAKLLQLMRSVAVEAFSTATLGIVDFLNLIRHALMGFIKAAAKGIKGVSAYIKQLRKGEAVFNDSEGVTIIAPRKQANTESIAALATADLVELPEKEFKQLITNSSIRNRIRMHFKDLKFYKQGDEYVVMYEGEKLFAHSHSPYINNFIEKLFKQPDSAKKLKKLKEFAKNRRIAFTKWGKKLTPDFSNHIGGDVIPEGIDTTFGEFLYVGTKGQGGHYVNDFVNVKTIEIPPGINSLDDLADDIPFKAKVDIQSLQGQVFPKDASSSMFPKNWNIERIKEEALLVYENTVAKGLKPLPIKPNQKFNRYQAESTAGFDILIEIDNAGNIVNAYPKID